MEDLTTSAVKVLETYELLEMILLLLPPGTVLKLQSACKRWESVISSSSEIQKHMFLQADSVAIAPGQNEAPWEVWTPSTYSNELRINTLLFSNYEFIWQSHRMISVDPAFNRRHPSDQTPSESNMFIT